MIPRTLLVSALVALVVGVASCGSARSPAATINGTDITDEELAHEVDVFSFLGSLNQSPCGTPEQGETVASACARFTLGNLIQQRIVVDYASGHEIQVTEPRIRDTIDGLDGQLGKETVDGRLSEHGLTRADLHDLARVVLLFQDVRQAVTAERLTDDVLRSRYEQEILSYTVIQVDHILLTSEAEAQDVYRQVTAPGAAEKDFRDLAENVSIDPSAQQNSGSLGSATASTYVPEFGNAAVALEPGEISRPVQTQYGWHVIRMVDKQVTPFQEARQRLVDQEAGATFNEWMRDQLREGAVQVNPKYGRLDIGSLSVLPIRSTELDGGAGQTATPSPVASP